MLIKETGPSLKVLKMHTRYILVSTHKARLTCKVKAVLVRITHTVKPVYSDHLCMQKSGLTLQRTESIELLGHNQTALEKWSLDTSESFLRQVSLYIYTSITIIVMSTTAPGQRAAAVASAGQ